MICSGQALESERAECPLCGSNDGRVRFQDGPFSLLDCDGCRVAFVNPRRSPESLIEEVYTEDYFRSSKPCERGYSDYVGDRLLYQRTFERRWKSLRSRLPATGRALDVGCAAGDFLLFLQGQGWDVQGVEPSEEVAAIAREKLGAESVQTATLDRASLMPGSFDLITLWDVLEHLPQPLGALRRVRNLLAPGGRAIIETQDISSWMARACGRRWQHYKHDEHLVHFSPVSLQLACQKAGLRVSHWQRRAAGKYVRGSFLVERSARLHAGLPRLLAPILGGDWSVYVNPGDEMIAIVEVQP